LTNDHCTSTAAEVQSGFVLREAQQWQYGGSDEQTGIRNMFWITLEI